MAEITFSINGVSNQTTLPFAVELMWNHLLAGSYKKAADVGSAITDDWKDFAREIWETERRLPDGRPGTPVCPF